MSNDSQTISKADALDFLRSLLNVTFESARIFDPGQSSLEIIYAAGLCERGQDITDLPQGVHVLYRLIEATRLPSPTALPALQRLQRTIGNKLRVGVTKISLK